jgi:DNA-directed RNA polymerase specialized sigma subunit
LDIKKMLRDYPGYSEGIQKLNKELNETLQLKLVTQNTLKAQALTGMPHSSGISDITYNAVEKSIDRHEQHINYLCGQIQDIYDKKEFIDNAIKRLTVEEYQVIELYYFKEFKMRRVAYIMHYNKNYVYEILKRAMFKIETTEKI